MSFFIFVVNNYVNHDHTVIHKPKCYDVYCSTMYGKIIWGDDDSVAKACSVDPKCKGFSHSLKNGFGFLCSSLDVKAQYDDWKLCKFQNGKVLNIFVRTYK